VYDVIVSGAGPSGSYAAYLLAMKGYRTVLVECDHIPRQKCCAGGVMRRAAKSLDFPIPDHIIERNVTGVSVIIGDKHHDIDTGHTLISTVRRAKFDEFLTMKAVNAGSELVVGSRLEHITEHADQVEVSVGGEAMEARALVIAEGAISRNANLLLGPYPGSHSSMGMAVECNERIDCGNLAQMFMLDTPTDTIRWGPGFPLMGWMFPLRSGCNIGIAGSGYSQHQLKEGMELVSKYVGSTTGVRPSIDGYGSHPIPLRARKRLHTRRTLVVGDAAGMTSAISGEGMSYSFMSAKNASKAIDSLLTSPRGDPLSLYDRLSRDSIVRDMKAAELIAPVLHWLVGVVDPDRFFDNVVKYEGIVNASENIAFGDKDWRALLAKAITSFPSLFFSSI
jgi:geranylgeranyl reductase family protein